MILIDTSFIIPPLFIYFIHHHKYIRHIRNKDLFINSLTTVQFLYLEKCHSSPRVVIVTVSSKDHGKYIPSNE